MKVLINNVALNIEDKEEAAIALICRKLGVKRSDILSVKLRKLSIDARRKNAIKKIASYVVETSARLNSLPEGCEEFELKDYVFKRADEALKYPIYVVGSGPCGLFAAYTLMKAGLDVVLLERGYEVEKRVKAVESFYNTGVLDTRCNVQFGEGGAGTFSDGKLTTGIKSDKCALVKKVLYEYGAPEDILYSATPHIGTDYLRGVVSSMRKAMSPKVETRFNTLVKDIVIENRRLVAIKIESENKEEVLPAERVIFAIGHSARDTYSMLIKRGIDMKPKPFSIGARIEHLREDINAAQHGKLKGLGAASYKLSTHLKSGRGVYTFCMCPGGSVVAGASEDGGVVVNGMSNYDRGAVNSNSALLVSVSPEDYGNDCMRAIEFQRSYEAKAYALGGRSFKAPAQLVGDFLNGKASSAIGKVKPSYPLGVTLADLRDCLPEFAVASMREALPIFDNKIKGFAGHDAILTGVETRSSAPIQIARYEACASNIQGLYFAGEGAGFAGGIMSAAVDGMTVAESVIDGIGLLK